MLATRNLRKLNFFRPKVLKAPKYCRENAPELVLEAKQNQSHKLVLLLTNSLRTVGTAAKQQGPPEYI